MLAAVATRVIRPSFHRTVVVRVLVALLGASAVAHSAIGPPPATDANNATPGNYGWFEAGLQWRGEFADPAIARVGNTYYVYSSGAGGRYLGVMTSTDLVHWVAHPRWSQSAAPWLGGPDPRTDPSIPFEIRHSGQVPGDIWNLNDALVRPAAWGYRRVFNAWYHRSYWAVGIAHIGAAWYAYAGVQISPLMGDGTADPDGFGRYCLTVAKASSPLGPFRDITGSQPLYCDPDPGGSIDPSPYYDAAHHQWWMTWKANGRLSRPGVAGYPSALKTVRLDATGHMYGPIHTVLTTREGSWEGYTIENPAMIQYRGRWYLFYSANHFQADSTGHSPYATGYAICAGVAGPCVRPTPYPLMASNARESGPGGAQPFLDTAGNLKLAYASYWPGENRPNTGVPHPRRLHIADVTWHADGTLSVAH